MASNIIARVILLILLLVGIALNFAFSARSHEGSIQANLESVPVNFEDVKGLEDQIDARTLDVLQASQTLNRQYFIGEEKYWLFIGYFARQRFGSQIHSPRHCYPGSGWSIIEHGRSSRWGHSSGELLIQKDRERRVVLYRYVTRGGDTNSEYRLKLEMIKNSLLGRPLDAALVRFSTPVGKNESKEQALERLSIFAHRLDPYVNPALPF